MNRIEKVSCCIYMIALMAFTVWITMAFGYAQRDTTRERSMPQLVGMAECRGDLYIMDDHGRLYRIPVVPGQTEVTMEHIILHMPPE